MKSSLQNKILKISYNDGKPSKIKNIFLADCRKLLDKLPLGSVDLVATDPPYFFLKNYENFWDKQWEEKSKYFLWVDEILKLLAGVLKPTGSIYWFASSQLAAEIKVNLFSKHFTVLNEIIWVKPEGRHKGTCKEVLRQYFPQTEHIIFGESKDAQGYQYQKEETLVAEVYKHLKEYLDK